MARLRPCHCPSCNGKLRDKRTIKSHYSSIHVPISNSNSSVNTCGLHVSETVHILGNHKEAAENESCLLAGNDQLGSDEDEGTCQESEGDDENGEEVDLSHDSGDANSSDESCDASQEAAGDSDIDSRSSNDAGRTCHYTENDITNAVLRSIESKIKNGWSQEETLSEMRNLFELLKDERLPHKSWDAILKYLKKLGYKDPKYFKVCCASNHVSLLQYQADCSVCGKSWEECLKYYVLGIHLENYFLNDETIKDHLQHWANKDEWLGNNQEEKYKETWHGEHFQELSYFWDDTSETFLPVLCPNCESVISVEEMAALVPPGNTLHDELYLSCRECMFDFVHKPKKMKGCALNQAFIFHEDGFNAFEKKSRGVSAIHISSACVNKEQRLSGKYLRVYSFIPTVFLDEGISHKLDAFLKPLIDEVKDLYINGITVNIQNEITLKNDIVVRPGQYQVRMLLLAGTADLKGHQEMILYAGGGKFGCRICQVLGTYIPSKRHYYYGNFGVRYRHQAQPKSPQYYLEHGEKIENATTVTQRKTLQTESGVTGISILFELFHLYKFDPVRDMVIDRMHLTFNMLKREFMTKIWAEIGDNAGKLIDARDPALGGLIDRNEFGNALDAIPWPPEERAKGVAKLKSLTDKLSSWKSNEFKKFSEIAREVLSEMIPSEAYDCFMLLCQAVQMLYSKELKISGWSEENISRLNNLLWAHAVRAEEYYGLDYCTENLEYSTHAASQIKRHSSLDNYSCELFERMIRRHKQQKHNSRGIEKTYASRESIRDFLYWYKQKNGALSSYEEKPKYQFKIEILQNRTPFYLKEASLQSATDLLTDFKDTPDVRMRHAMKYGVLLGKVVQKACSVAVISDIQRHLRRETGLQNLVVPNILQTSKTVALFDQYEEVNKVALLDTIKIKSTNTAEEWIMKVEEIIQVGPVEGLFYTYVNGTYHVPVFQNGEVDYHMWTGTPKFITRTYQRNRVQPLASFCRKVMMYPVLGNTGNPNYFLCIDYKNAELVKTIKVPIYPDVGETVRVKGTGNQEWYGKINQVYVTERKARVQWYRETRRNGIWTLTNGEDDIYFRSLIGLTFTERVFGGFRITDVS